MGMKMIFLSVTLLLVGQVSYAATGDIITLAGGNSYYAPYPPTIDALANSTYLATPYTVDVHASGDVFITDAISHTIKKVSRTTGMLSLVAGTGVAGFSGDSGLATSASIKTPYSVVFDAAGNLYFSDEGNHVIRKIDVAGVITTVVGTPNTPGYLGDGGDALAARIHTPAGLAFDSLGNLFFADEGNHVIRKIDKTTNIITTVAGVGTFGFAGDAGLATNATLFNPVDIALDGNDNLLITDSGNGRIRKVDAATGVISTWKSGLGLPYGIAIDASNTVYYTEKTSHQVTKVDTLGNVSIVAGSGVAGNLGDGGLASQASLNAPTDVAVDSFGNIIIADLGNRSVRFVGKVLDFPLPTAGLNYPSLDEVAMVNDLDAIQAMDASGSPVANTTHNFILPSNYNALQQFNVSFFASDSQGGIGATQVGLTLDRIRLERMDVQVKPPANVNVLFRAYDATTNKPFANLLPSDLLIYEDQFAVSVESSVVMTKVTEAKHRIDTVLMIDISNSILPADLATMKQSLIQGIFDASGTKLLVKDQRVAVYTFDKNVTQIIDFTSDPVAIQNAINGIQLSGLNSTNLYGAIVEGMARVETFATVTDLVEGQVLLVTDGRDTAGLVGFYTAKNSIKNNRLHIIAVNVTPTVAGVLASLAPDYSLNYTDAADFSAVATLLRDVAQYTDDLAYSFYRLDYTSSYSGGVHTLGIRGVKQADYSYTRLLNISFDTKDFIPAEPPIVLNESGGGCLASGSLNGWFFLGILFLLGCLKKEGSRRFVSVK